MNFLTTPKQPTSGRMLTSDEERVIDEINSFPYPKLKGFGSLGAINAQIPVEIQDKKNPYHVETVHYDLDEINKQRENAWYKLKHSENWERQVEYYDNILSQCKNTGSTEVKVPVPWLGCFCPATQRVVLFMGEIGKSISQLAVIHYLVATYVHEMFHAYFNTNGAIDRIEEPIVEYATLCFLKDYDAQRGTSYFSDALKSIKREQISMGAFYYGLGAYLYEQNKVDWVDLYKKNNTQNFSGHAHYPKYMDLMANQYPFDKEEVAQEELYLTITGKKSVSAKLSGRRKFPISKAADWALLEKDNEISLYVNCDMSQTQIDSFLAQFQILRKKDANCSPKIKVLIGPNVVNEVALKSIIEVCLEEYNETCFIRHTMPKFSSSKKVIACEKGVYIAYINTHGIYAWDCSKIFHGKGCCEIYLGPNAKGQFRVKSWDNTTLFLDDKNENYCIVNDLLLSADKTILYHPMKMLKKVVIPNEVVRIEEAAFYRCKSLSDIVIPSSVKEIGERAFGYCKSIKDVVDPASIETIGSQAFEGCGMASGLLIYDNGKKCYGWVGKKSDCISVIIPNGVTEIGEYAFDSCMCLCDVRIPGSVTKIGGHAFQFCKGLSEVHIPDSVREIGTCAFNGCRNLCAIHNLDGVEKIGVHAFYDTAL